jgi:putative SOS response-associated peptidase YedK
MSVNHKGLWYDLFAFLTTGPNREVGAIHPKAMPVILTEPEELETWLVAPWGAGEGAEAALAGWCAGQGGRGVKQDV